MNINYKKWLYGLYKKNIIGTDDNSLFYYCNPSIEVDTKNNIIIFDIVPYHFNDDFEKKCQQYDLTVDQAEGIEKLLNMLCKFVVTNENINFIMNCLDAMGFIREMMFSESDCRNYLNAICDYDFSNFSESTYPDFYSRGEEFLTIDGKDIY